MIRKGVAAVLCTVLGLTGARHARADLVNGDFSDPGLPRDLSHYALPESSPYLTGWDVTDGVGGTPGFKYVEYIDLWSQDPGGECVEIGYSFFSSGIEQKFATSPNAPYLVSFYLATDPLNGDAARLRVGAGDTTADFTAPPRTGNQSDLGWVLRSMPFLSDDSGFTTLSFRSISGIAAIDTVSVVPEPGVTSVLLLMLATVVRRSAHWQRR